MKSGVPKPVARTTSTIKKGPISPHVRRYSSFQFKEGKEDDEVDFTPDSRLDEDWRSTGIVCTLGPGSDSIEVMESLLEAGLDVARFNFSHGSHEYHKKLMENVRQAAKNCNKLVAIALDTKGPEIRTGTFPAGDLILKTGSKVTITTDPAFEHKGTEDKFWVTYKDLTKSVKPGMTIFIDDGLLSLTVESVSETEVMCEVKEGGEISNRKGVNLPGAVVTLPALSEKDIGDIKFGVEMKVDMIFASFIRKAEDVESIRKLIPKSILIISKIENQEGCDNFEKILGVSDGIMVARGDLGIEIDPTTVFVQQKRMIRMCRQAGKPVIVATQMLQSMVTNPRPTRAEVSDVANAVLDGADCVMLSGETAKGKYPRQAVEAMGKTCQVAEQNLNLAPIVSEKPTGRKSVVAAACKIAREMNAAAIVVVTNTGTTARLISRFRPNCPVLAVIGSSNASKARHLLLSFGIHVCVYEEDNKGPRPSALARISAAIESQMDNVLKKDDWIVCVYSMNHFGYANIVELKQI
mmetsp:Transcript_1515/g.2096  ORF Transcript_1515/g.2096 Transcript_1515/m.2096 type:complete len:523 (-) Transcript_1515:26-1594(-)|eukprot:CAMPEP_0184499828 /NCGR_PEP_ID=MMETSP0113_2-20130426/42652_1 /TAXON_ID=91329 /ORGANISM="Norrisiella sphaerica, Strain BC52" /LENGTH=522 /DNA_ID=CAMNT_0026887897 /DNA_START=58 /DNA_END=1626 /DNA_ORIENTATION=+